MSHPIHDNDTALLSSRREFLKGSLSMAAGLSVLSLAGLPALAAAQGAAGAPVGLGTIPRWGAGGDFGPASCNALSGNCLFRHPVACAESLDFVLYYNSQSPSSQGPLGPRWRHSFSGQIIAGSGAATYLAADGSAFVFASSGSAYVAPAGCFKSLVKNSDNSWTLSDNGGTAVRFLPGGALDSVRNKLTGAVLIQCNYNASGQLTSVQKDSDVLYFGYSGGKLASVTDFGGLVHTFGYANGVLSSHNLPPLGSATPATAFSYSAAGLLNKVTKPDGFWHSYAFDSSGALTSFSDQAGGTGSMAAAYAPSASPQSGSTLSAGNQSSMNQALWPSDVAAVGSLSLPSGTVQYGFDSAGRMVAYSGGTDRSVYSYDSNNNITSQTLASGGAWTWTYDAYGRPTSLTSPNGVAKSYSLDPQGRILSLAVGGVSEFNASYDNNSNVTQVAYTGGETYSFGYDASRNLTSVSHPASGLGSSAVCDGSGKVTSLTNVFGSTATYSYASGRLTFATDARGRTSAYTYDGWGRQTGVQFPTSSHPSESWGYDVMNRLTSGTNAAGSFSFGYDGKGRLTSKVGPQGVVSAAYSNNGLQNAVTDDAGRSHSFAWGSNSAVSSISLNDGTGSIQCSYNSDNQLASYALPNGTIVEYSYSNARLTSVATKVASTGAVLVSYSGTFNAITGFLAQIAESPSGAVTTYGYDSLGRLTSENRSGPSSYQSTYTYGSKGQILTAYRSENGTASHSGTYTYSTAGLLQTVVDSATGKTEQYTYFGDGRLASFSGPGYVRKLDYYEDGKLLSISRDSGNGAVLAYEFAYDPDGFLTWYKDYVLGAITMVSTGTGLLAGRTLIIKRRAIGGGAWTEVARYVQGLDRTLAVSGAYFAGALVGGPFLATNSARAVIGTCLFDSFGVYRYRSGTFASGSPGRVVLDGVSISMPDGSAAIPERRLVIGG